MPNQSNLRDNLFDSEPLSSDRQQRFREELAQIIEPALPRSHRLYYQLTLACLAIGIPCAACGLIFDAPHRWNWGLNLVISVSAAIWILFILRRGAEPFRTIQSLSKAIVGLSAFAVFALISLGLQDPSLDRLFWAFLGMLLFLLSNFMNLWNRTLAAERITREQILRLEYRIADLASHLIPPDGGPKNTTG